MRRGLRYGNPKHDGSSRVLVDEGSRVWRVVYRQAVEVEEVVVAKDEKEAKAAIRGQGQGTPVATVGEEVCGPRKFVVIEELPAREARDYWKRHDEH